MTVDLKIVSSASANGSGEQGQGFRGLRLPTTIVGRLPDAPPVLASSDGGQ